jgi:hypothetical protein
VNTTCVKYIVAEYRFVPLGAAYSGRYISTSTSCAGVSRVYVIGRTFAIPSGPRQTLKGNTVVAIGVRRRGVGRDNCPCHAEDTLAWYSGTRAEARRRVRLNEGAATRRR